MTDDLAALALIVATSFLLIGMGLWPVLTGAKVKVTGLRRDNKGGNW